MQVAGDLGGQRLSRPRKNSTPEFLTVARLGNVMQLKRSSCAIQNSAAVEIEIGQERMRQLNDDMWK